MRSILLIFGCFLLCCSSSSIICCHCSALSPQESSVYSYNPSPSSSARRSPHQYDKSSSIFVVLNTSRGGDNYFFIPPGWNPFGYQVTKLGEQFLEFDGSLDSDLGRFLASCRSRKSLARMKSEWLEIVRASKKGQALRIYRGLEENFIPFCLKARLLD